ncbi:cyclin E-interacting protein minus [Calliopsis andreniformis]|uniref:cyclin E-interacting protein minus n=1 Tax=Calliopsis andreniformis TaxID=337506 RepID=UPI003FCDAC55
MACCYFNRDGSLTAEKELPNISSPEMFDSDNENDKNNETLTNEEIKTTIDSPVKPSQADLIAKSDNNLLARINKFLSGVPPPPKHTICRTDCAELLLRIYENHHLFWMPCVLPGKPLQQNVNQESPEQQKENISTNNSYQCTKSTSRNLSIAFDACDPQYTSDVSDNLGTTDKKNNICSDNFKIKQIVPSDQKNVLNTNKSTVKVLDTEQMQEQVQKNVVEQAPPMSRPEQSLIHHNIDEKEAVVLTWPEAYSHKFYGIHYNRNRAVEEFENLTIKLCERYIGAETQSTCTVWFSKHAPGSAKKRNLLAKRENGQSPGKRLNHLTKRRRAFSSANLQGLTLNNKKLLVLNIKKPTVKKGKSPRGKSPRGKSPRGTPRSSTKKRVARRLVLDGSSPLKSKIETSKRALFQSPPDRAGPSKLLTTGTDLQNIKRALFTQKTKESDSEDAQKVTVEESRKRKSEEELEGPRYKWAKSLSFDCSHELHNNTVAMWDRHSSSNIIEKGKVPEGRNELSDAHRKKLLWAVAEALRSKGIGMTHPQFKQYATNLARTIKKFMPDLENRNIPRKPGSTSDRMLKLAKHHVLFVIDARPTD